jgi:hypothetical protein
VLQPQLLHFRLQKLLRVIEIEMIEHHQPTGRSGCVSGRMSHQSNQLMKSVSASMTTSLDLHLCQIEGLQRDRTLTMLKFAMWKSSAAPMKVTIPLKLHIILLCPLSNNLLQHLNHKLSHVCLRLSKRSAGSHSMSLLLAEWKSTKITMTMERTKKGRYLHQYRHQRSSETAQRALILT